MIIVDISNVSNNTQSLNNLDIEPLITSGRIGVVVNALHPLNAASRPSSSIFMSDKSNSISKLTQFSKAYAKFVIVDGKLLIIVNLAKFLKKRLMSVNCVK